MTEYNNKSLRLVLGAGTLLLGLSATVVADSGMTATMLSDTCAGCHGTVGNSVGPAIPSIAEMDPTVFVETMEGFKDGTIYSTVMDRIAKGYSTSDFEKMAEYFKQQTFRPAPQPFDESLVAAGEAMHQQHCERCHIEGGRPLADEEEYHILAGQWTPYLRYTMEDFLAYRRPMERRMATELERLIDTHGEEGLEAVWAFYASQQ